MTKDQIKRKKWDCILKILFSQYFFLTHLKVCQNVRIHIKKNFLISVSVTGLPRVRTRFEHKIHTRQFLNALILSCNQSERLCLFVFRVTWHDELRLVVWFTLMSYQEEFFMFRLSRSSCVPCTVIEWVRSVCGPGPRIKISSRVTITPPWRNFGVSYSAGYITIQIATFGFLKLFHIIFRAPKTFIFTYNMKLVICNQF